MQKSNLFSIICSKKIIIFPGAIKKTLMLNNIKLKMESLLHFLPKMVMKALNQRRFLFALKNRATHELFSGPSHAVNKVAASFRFIYMSTGQAHHSGQRRAAQASHLLMRIEMLV